MKSKEFEKKFLTLEKEISDLKHQEEDRKDEIERLNKLVDELRRDLAELRDLVEMKEEETRLLKGVVSQYVTGQEIEDVKLKLAGSVEVISPRDTSSNNSVELPMSPYPDELHRERYSDPNKTDSGTITRKSSKFNIGGDFSMQKIDTKLLSPISAIRAKPAVPPRTPSRQNSSTSVEQGCIEDKWDVREATSREGEDVFVVSHKLNADGADHEMVLSRTNSEMSEGDYDATSSNELYTEDDRYSSRQASMDDMDFDRILQREKKELTTGEMSEGSLLRYENDINAVIKVQKAARGLIARRQTRMMKRRTEVVKELVQTEIGYVSSLDVLIKFYLKPLRKNSTSPDSFILPSYLDEIFSTVEDMRQNNGEILTELVNKMSSWNYYSCISDIFINGMDVLQAHLPYIVNYERAQAVVKACKKIPEFVAFVNERMKMAELEYKALDDFLILPVQRIPRYIMLLESMLKYTPAGHPDKDNTQTAVTQMRAFAQHINKRKESRVKLVDTAKKVVGVPQDQDLLAESRYLVREGVLMDEKRRTPRFCILLNDVLIVTKPSSMRSSGKISIDELKKKKFNYEYAIQLSSATKLLVSLAGEVSTTSVNSVTTASATTQFILTFVNQQTKYVFNTHPDDDGKAWVKDIHLVLDSFRKKILSPRI